MIRKDSQTSELVSASDDIPIEAMFRHLKSLNPYPNASSQNFGKFVVKRPLSGGSQSAVLLAFDPDLRREVVIKVYSPNLTRDQKSMVLEEGRALSQIKSDHVARCLSVDTLEDCPYLVLEYVAGHALDRLSLPLESDTALEIIRQIALAVDAVHDRGILHLDLKPSNVMLADDGTIKLIDFGLAQPISNVSFGHVSGTPAFMAPEVAEHDVSLIDRRADIFGVGAILYYLLTGEVLFEGETREEVIRAAKECKIRPISELAPNVSPIAKQLCQKCLQKNPAERYANIGVLQDVLPQEGRRRFLRRLLIAGVVAAMAFVGWFSWPGAAVDPSGDHIGAIAKLLAGETDVQIVQDFAMPFEIQRADGSLIDSEGVLEFDGPERIQLSVKPVIKCWIALFSVEFDERRPGVRCLVPIADDGKYVSRTKGHATWTRSLDLLPTHGGKEEYLVILARNELWNAESLEQEVMSRTSKVVEQVPPVKRGARGLSQIHKSAGIIIRYNVRTKQN